MSQSPERDFEAAAASQAQYEPVETRNAPRQARKEALRAAAEEDTMGSIWEQVKYRNEFGHYTFERFESMQLLNLCLQQHEIRGLADEIYRVIGSGNHYPADMLRGKAGRLKPMLKEYSTYSPESRQLTGADESLIAVHEVMGYPKADISTISPWDKTLVANIPRLMVGCLCCCSV